MAVQQGSLMCHPVFTYMNPNPRPKPKPEASAVKVIRRNLFGTRPGECQIDAQLARAQQEDLLRVKAKYNLDLLADERREQELAEVTGLRAPFAPQNLKDQQRPPVMGAGVAISKHQISTSIRNIKKSGSSITQQSLKRHFRARKNVKGIVPKKIDVINNNLNINGGDNRSSELEGSKVEK
ncbi:hypothetical protein KR018_008014 [Drosophila ironensis]|nr:hypothetical protein KR018_008014 [Drosophila ironensis]